MRGLRRWSDLPAPLPPLQGVLAWMPASRRVDAGWSIIVYDNSGPEPRALSASYLFAASVLKGQLETIGVAATSILATGDRCFVCVASGDPEGRQDQARQLLRLLFRCYPAVIGRRIEWALDTSAQG